ncbi:MAG: hypothetical protein DHS20C13_28010 [Thermodesulfobacteriota bacterium]|nr:MAG: hypothetical protein DHS20C13_28010 [Thermodesulfobacteriota bacterium]
MSYKKAVEEKCRDCTYDDCASGTWRQQVTLCSAKTCPLYDVRPKSKSPIPEPVLLSHGIKTDTSRGFKVNCEGTA